MSKKAEVDSLVIELSEVRKYVERLQGTMSQLASELQEIRLSRAAIEELLNKGSLETLISLDGRGHTYVRGVISEVKSVIAHIGSNYYAEVNSDLAIKLLNDKEGDALQALRMIEGELNKVLTYYQQLQETLNKVLKEQQEKVK
ncbi:MAG: prefoldin subunit alpha [Sulfolobales archaeon]|nr:prefoldin subunit alpha [Sulfolobales archaeon]MDW7968940.1 prefoldin subunit alpha [Sulfolobales archaeon]